MLSIILCMAGLLLKALRMLTHLFFSTNPKKHVHFVMEETKAKREGSNVLYYTQVDGLESRSSDTRFCATNHCGKPRAGNRLR